MNSLSCAHCKCYYKYCHSILYYFTFLEKLLTNDIGVWPVKQSRVFRSTSVSKICWLLIAWTTDIQYICTNVRGRVFVSKTAVVISASGGRCWWAKQIGVTKKRKIRSPVSSWSVSGKQRETAAADKVRSQWTVALCTGLHFQLSDDVGHSIHSTAKFIQTVTQHVVHFCFHLWPGTSFA